MCVYPIFTGRAVIGIAAGAPACGTICPATRGGGAAAWAGGGGAPMPCGGGGGAGPRPVLMATNVWGKGNLEGTFTEMAASKLIVLLNNSQNN